MYKQSFEIIRPNAHVFILSKRKSSSIHAKKTNLLVLPSSFRWRDVYAQRPKRSTQLHDTINKMREKRDVAQFILNESVENIFRAFFFFWESLEEEPIDAVYENLND